MAIEPLNRFEIYFLNTAEDAVRLCDEIDHPNVGILFDTFHANIEVKDIARAYRTVGNHFKHVHTCENDRGIPVAFHALRDIAPTGIDCGRRRESSCGKTLACEKNFGEESPREPTAVSNGKLSGVPCSGDADSGIFGRARCSHSAG